MYKRQLSTSVAFTGLTDLLTSQRRIAVSDPLMVAFRDNSVLGLPWPLVYLLGAVSYTHLDVYKRQTVNAWKNIANNGGYYATTTDAGAGSLPAKAG